LQGFVYFPVELLDVVHALCELFAGGFVGVDFVVVGLELVFELLDLCLLLFEAGGLFLAEGVVLQFNHV
jgi:hypothetical protein